MELENKLQEAREVYQNIKLNEEAFRCYWKGQHFQDLSNLAHADPSLTRRLEAQIADFKIGSRVPEQFLTAVGYAINH